MLKVVAIAYTKEGKLLTCETRSSIGVGIYTLVGGKVEAGETAEDAAIRETREETGLVITKDDFFEIENFIEPAASDPDLIIEMTLFVYKHEFHHDLSTSAEILKFKWYDVTDNPEHLSTTIRLHLLPWAIEHGILYTSKK
jgi:8-oxo-dGTP pyrophosphatase MutT (NUDIX family)